MNNKTIIEFGCRITWRIMEISEGVIRLSLRPRRISQYVYNKTPSSISIMLHKLRYSASFINCSLIDILSIQQEGSSFREFWLTPVIQKKSFQLAIHCFETEVQLNVASRFATVSDVFNATPKPRSGTLKLSPRNQLSLTCLCFFCRAAMIFLQTSTTSLPEQLII